MDCANGRRDRFIAKRLQADGLVFRIVQRSAERLAKEHLRKPFDECDAAGSCRVNLVSHQLERRLEPRRRLVVMAPNVDHLRKRREDWVLRVSSDGECTADEMRASAHATRAQAQIRRYEVLIQKVFEPKGRTLQAIA